MPAAEGARQAKDAERAAVEKEVRPEINFVQGYPKTANADRAEMGITVRDASPSPAPTIAPARAGGERAAAHAPTASKRSAEMQVG